MDDRIVEEYEEFIAPHTPGTQATWDQLHARALDTLRESRTFLLLTVQKGDDGLSRTIVACGSCETAVERTRLLAGLVANAEGITRSLCADVEDAA